MSTKTEKSPLSMAFGRAVRTMREKSGNSQEKFAYDCGMDRAYYGLLERGGRHPTIKTVWIIANALGKRPRDLIAATENQMEVGDQEPEAEKGAQESTTSPVAKNTGTHLGYAGESGKTGKPGKGSGKD